MSKVPSSLKVKFIISDLTLEIPKAFFNSAGLKIALYVGRKGKGSLTRRSKWFTVTDASKLPTSTRAITVLDETEKKKEGVAAPKEGEEPKTKEITGEMVVLKFGGLNDVEYDVEMHPINKYEGEWVFNPKMGHPLMVFAKVVAKYRPGVKVNIAATERDSNFNDMAGIDDVESADDFSDDEDINSESEVSHLNVSEMVNLGLSLEQVQSLTGEERSENEVLAEQLIREVAPVTRRYMAFPKMLDLSDVVNTKSKVASYSERMKCKAADMVGTMLSFNLKAIVPEDKMTEYDAKSKEKADKEARKRREKEEKLLEKERKKQEKEEKKKSKTGKAYGAEANEGGGHVTDTNETPHSEAKQKEKKANAGTVIKDIFTSKKEIQSQITPFPLKCASCPVPFLVYLDNFKLKNLRMAPEYYRAVHIRLGSDSNSLDTYPLLLLDASNPDCAQKQNYISFDGTPKSRYILDFGDSHIFFGHKHIRNVTGFDTICALIASEKNYYERKKREEAGETPEEAAEANPFQTELLDVGEKFIPFAGAPLKYSSNDAQCKPTKFTRVTASLIVPAKLTNVPMINEDQEKLAYIKKLKRELKEKEKAEKEKEAEKKRELEKKKKQQQGAVAAEGENHPTGSDANESSIKKPESEKKAEEEKEVKKPEGGGEKKEGEEGGEAFQSSGAAETAVAVDPKAASKASKASRIVVNQSKSFQLPVYILNEEYIPKEGIKYVIRFKTGEELHFRARRLFLPSISDKGHLAAYEADVSLAQFEDGQAH